MFVECHSERSEESDTECHPELFAICHPELVSGSYDAFILNTEENRC